MVYNPPDVRLARVLLVTLVATSVQSKRFMVLDVAVNVAEDPEHVVVTADAAVPMDVLHPRACELLL